MNGETSQRPAARLTRSSFSDTLLRYPGKAGENSLRLDFFRQKTRVFPALPGVYKMFNHENKIIYIGKAKNLRSRVASYFHSHHERAITGILVAQIWGIDYIIAESEKEALVIENDLIKRYKPFFNIDLRDNKTYPYLVFSTENNFPQLFKTRKLGLKGMYFGPYTNVKLMNVYLDVVNSLYPLKKCAKQKFPKGFKPCLYYHIGKCLDYCSANVTKETIDELARKVKKLLKTSPKDLIGSLEIEMQKASEKLDYERAMTLRDSIGIMNSIEEEEPARLQDESSFDVLHYKASHGWMIIAVLCFREGKLLHKDVHEFKNELFAGGGETEEAIKADEDMEYRAYDLSLLVDVFSQFLYSYYKSYRETGECISRVLIPESIYYAEGASEQLKLSLKAAFADDELLPRLGTGTGTRGGGRKKEQSSLPRQSAVMGISESKQAEAEAGAYLGMARFGPVASELQEEFEFKVKVKAKKAPQLQTALRGQGRRYLELAKANAGYSFYELLRKKERQDQCKHLKEALGLKKIPQLVDCFDVANIGDYNIVAACVRFLRGEKDTSNYRLFNMRFTKTQNDFLSMAEAVFRHYRRMVEENKTLPDFVLIDGGKGQLSAALRSLENLGIDKKMVIASLAKKEELLFLPKLSQPIKLSHQDPALQFLVHVRDEAHRFVNKHHQWRRSKQAFQSSLHAVKGLGLKKTKTLLRHFDSLEELKLASKEKVLKLPFIGEKDYCLLVSFFQSYTYQARKKIEEKKIQTQK